MATLPQGWVADYDGQRWFYCYTATSHTQYHFPKPGDEFPEFSLLGDHSKNDGLLPEEKLESERQVRKRAALKGAQKGTTIGKRRSGGVSGNEKQDGKVNDENDMFAFESFGYLGPGNNYNGISRPGHNVDGRTVEGTQRPPSSGATSSLANAFGTRTGPGEDEGEGEEGLAPQTSEPLTTHNMNVPDHAGEMFGLPFLPARPCQPVLLPHASSAGPIAELVSESTALCEEEINPPPVELPSTGPSWLESRPLPELVNQCPVELPSVEGSSPLGHSIPMNQDERVQRPGQETKTTTRTDAVRDENQSAWCTNWMSTSTEAAQAPPRSPKVTSPSDSPLRRVEGPQISSNTTREENMYQEIVDFFPAVLSLSDNTQNINDAAKGASFTMRDNETRQPSISPTSLSHFPSVLRPGPRRSNPASGRIAQVRFQESNTPEDEGPPPAVDGHPSSRLPSLYGQQNTTTTVRLDSSPPVLATHAPAQVHDEVFAMPDPNNFVRGSALLPRDRKL